jgi:hypothetical protein
MIEPQGYDMDMWRYGMTISNIVNAVRSTIPTGRGKKPKVFKPQDFYPNQKKDDLTPAQRAYVERKRKRKKHG